MVLGVLSVDAVSISFEDINVIEEAEESDSLEEVSVSEIVAVQSNEIYIDKNSLEIEDNSSRATDYGIMTTAAEDGTLEYVKTINGYGYTASISKSANSRYWNVNTGYTIFANTTTYGATYSSTVPLFNEVYLTKGSLIKFNLYGGSCGHSPSYANIYINGNYFNQLYVAPYGSGVSSQQILYYKVEKSGNYSATAIGCAVGCLESVHHGIYILPSYDIYRYKYSLFYNLNGGILSKENPDHYYEEDGDITLNNPVKEGYTFTGWTGSDGTTPQTNVTIEGGSYGNKTYTANWKINQYPITYIDLDENGNEIGRTVKLVNYNILVRGSDIGDSASDNAYYNQYRYVSDTSATVTTDGAVVHRNFEFCYTEKESHLVWNDNDDRDGLRPKTYILKLKQNGKVIDEIELPSDQTDHIFDNLPKYDKEGKLYKYEVEVVLSDRYKTTYDADGNLIVEDYQPASFSVVIPKQIVLDGNTGKADYTVSVNGIFYYNDILTVKPESNLTLYDRSKISSMEATVSQQKTGFTKEDGVANGAIANGNIQVEREYFSGSWNGKFNFDIKFVMKN